MDDTTNATHPDRQRVLEDLTEAFRLVEKWSYNYDLNTIVTEGVCDAKKALQNAIENITLSDKEIEEREEQEGQEEEQKEQEEYEVHCEELKEAIPEILNCLTSSSPLPATSVTLLSTYQRKIVLDAFKDYISETGRILTNEDKHVLKSMLKEYLENFRII